MYYQYVFSGVGTRGLVPMCRSEVELRGDTQHPCPFDMQSKASDLTRMFRAGFVHQ
jgi:hypothetical protein